MTETWTNSEYVNTELNIDNYTIISRCDRADTTAGIGGGLLIYARNNLTVTEVKKSSCEYNFNQFTEIKVKADKSVNDVSIYLVYRPHKLYNSEDVKVNNQNLINLISNAKKHSIFVGDFNFRDIDWTNNHATNPQSKLFLDAVNNKFMKQMVDFSTHKSGSVLDLVLTEYPNLINNIQDAGYLGKSDHKILYFDVVLNPEIKESTKKVDDWSNADIVNIKKELSETNWIAASETLTLEDFWNFFVNCIDNVKSKYIPKKFLKKQSKPPWLSKEIEQLSKLKKRKWRRFRISKLSTHYEDYNNADKLLKNRIKKAKKNYERKLGNNAKNNPKQFYSYMKSKTKNKDSVGPLKTDDGCETSDDKEMAELLNGFFGSVFTEENISNIPTVEPVNTTENTNRVKFTEDNVKQKIDSLKIHSAPGPDGITGKFLKEFKDELAKPLALLFNKSYESGKVPCDWKKANVTPIFKKGSKFKACNYRPVSLTCIICKIMESIIKDNLVQYLEENNLITNSQHGFRQKRSCLTNLLEYVEKLTKAIDSGQDLDMIYLDFSKAFDKVPIKRLLVKIKAIGVNEKTCQWIEDWLLNRKQRVIINGKASDWISVMSGVPQGSVLGPLLFVIFINDIDRAVNSSQAILSKFADDTKCGNVILNEQSCETLQNDINNLLDWADKWQMQFNADKCKVLHFGRNNPRHSYYMNGYAPAGTILCNDDHEKDVGVYISTTLKPSLNCQNAANKANSVLGQMSRSVTYRDRITWIKLYKQYVRPHLEYCVQAWSPWLEHDKKILEQVQERAVRMVSGLKGKTYEERLKELNLSSLEDRRKRGDMIQVWKIINKHDNLPANQFFEFFQEGRQTTRLSANYQNIVKPRFKTDARKYSFSVRVVDAWNSLPTSVKSAKTLNSFKSLYDKCIVN